MSIRIRWTPEEQSQLTEAVVELHKGDPKTSLLKHVKQAQEDFLPADRRRNLAVVPPFIKDALKPKRASKKKRKMAAAMSRQPKGPALGTLSLDVFTDEQLKAELGKRLVKQAVRDYVEAMG